MGQEGVCPKDREWRGLVEDQRGQQSNVYRHWIQSGKMVGVSSGTCKRILEKYLRWATLNKAIGKELGVGISGETLHKTSTDMIDWATFSCNAWFYEFMARLPATCPSVALRTATSSPNKVQCTFLPSFFGKHYDAALRERRTLGWVALRELWGIGGPVLMEYRTIGGVVLR